MLSIDLSAILAGSGIRGEFEEKFKALIRDIEDEVGIDPLNAATCHRPNQAGRVICFIDEVRECEAFCMGKSSSLSLGVCATDMLFNLGKAEGSVDAGQMIKPALARGLQLVGATTRELVVDTLLFNSRKI